MSATPPIALAVTIHTLPWKMRVEKCPLSFQYSIPLGNSLDVYTAKHARSSRKVQDKLTSPCVVRDLVGIFKNRKWLFWDLPISVLKLQEYRTLRACHAVPADRRNKTLEWRLAMVNASSAIMSYALEQTNAARIGVICKSYSRGLQVILLSCLQAKGTAFKLFSNESFPHTPYSFPLYLSPADCFLDILFEQAGDSNFNKLVFFRHVTWHVCSVGAWKYLTWCQEGQGNAD